MMTGARYGEVVRQVGRLLKGGPASAQGEDRLLERFAADGDGAAFEALVARHGPMVLGTCRRMLADGHDVEDAFQATFLVLARKAGTIRDADRLGPWLHGVARRVARRSRAQADRRRSVEGPGGEDRAIAPAEGSAEAAELRAALDEELGRLPEKYRAPLVLCYLEGLTHDEAAGQLRWPVGTVRSRLAGGRDRLRGRLARRGLSPTAAPATLPILHIPTPLITTTVRLATMAGTPSGPVASLAKGAMTAMMISKLKLAAALGLLGSVAAGGAGAMAYQVAGGQVAAPAKPPADIDGDGKPDVVEAGPKPAADRIQEIQKHREAALAEVNSLAKRLEQLTSTIAKEQAQLLDKLAQAARRSRQLEQEWNALAINTSTPAPAGGPPQAPPKPEADRPPHARTSNHLKGEANQLRAQAARAKEQIETLDMEYQAKVEEYRAAKAAELAPAREKTPAPDAGSRKEIDAANARINLLEAELARMKRLTSPAPAPTASGIFGGGMGGGPVGGGPNVGGGMIASTTPRTTPDVMSLNGTPNVLVIPPDMDRATLLNTETNARDTYRPAQGVTQVIPVMGNHAGALMLKGAEIRQVAAFGTMEGKWYPFDLREPVKDQAAPAVGNDVVSYRLGRFLYVFSIAASKWSVLELKDEASGKNAFPVGGMYLPDGKMIITDGDQIHIYNAKTGEWTHLDAKAEK